jgi:hypothetical protein
MTGPRRCTPQDPRKPAPEKAPAVSVLPPTDRRNWSAPPELRTVREHFNRGDFRACVEPIEALYFARRNTLHQGLLQYVVALHQLRLGLVQTPRRLLKQALELWEPYGAWQEGLDLAALRAHAGRLLERLPEGVHSAQGEEVEQWWVAPPVLEPE